MITASEEVVYGQEGESFRKSWVAYVWPSFMMVCLLGTAWAAAKVSWKMSAVIVLLAITWYAYRVLYLRSIRLFTDAAGVWVFQGVLPWRRGHIGVKWRDLDDAKMFTGLVSWLFRSYTIRVGQRFTQHSEIYLTHIARGAAAVEHINLRHQLEMHADTVAAQLQASEGRP